MSEELFETLYPTTGTTVEPTEESYQLKMHLDDGLTSPLNTDLRTDEPHDFSDLSEEKREEKCLAQNSRIVYPTDWEIQLDIDNEHSYLLFNNQIRIARQYLSIVGIEEHPSKSGLPKRHITITLDYKVTPLERIALQACLGSDRIRELLGFMRLNLKQTNPTCFFEKKAGCNLA